MSKLVKNRLGNPANVAKEEFDHYILVLSRKEASHLIGVLAKTLTDSNSELFTVFSRKDPGSNVDCIVSVAIDHKDIIEDGK
jgi:hypothetical protein